MQNKLGILRNNEIREQKFKKLLLIQRLGSHSQGYDVAIKRIAVPDPILLLLPIW